jgi:methylated-DNA-[protein]-cysteine S-methyltransferase
MLYHAPFAAFEIYVAGGFVKEILYVKDDGNSTAIRPAREPAEDKNLLNQCIAQLDEYFVGKRKTFDIPIQQEGTDFQQRVWKELQNIRFGKTISYLQLAQRLGDVKSIRAAASANGRNKLNIIVPCHRVIGSNGSLTGYGGGLPRKKWLLDHESRFQYGVTKLF